jgi:hypothetical protein
LLLLALQGQSQVNMRREYAIFHRTDPNWIARKITSGIQSDSEKVKVIHYWITHHIAYDYKKYTRFDYTVSNLGKVMMKRKGICYDYSRLFDEMCYAAGVKSVMVNGYFKNWYVDLNDKAYLVEHSWNAVKTEDGWHLVDATWDAGYISLYKSTMRGYIIRTFTNGQRDIKRYKPRFIFNPVNDYFMSSPEYFLVTHLPGDPQWQLSEKTMAVEKFETDSSYYLSIYPSSEAGAGEQNQDSKHLSYFNLRPVERTIYNGFAYYSFNQKNHLDIGISWKLLALKDASNLAGKSTDTIAQLAYADSVIIKADSAIRHFTLTQSLLYREKEDLLENNRLKKEIFQSYMVPRRRITQRRISMYRTFESIEKQFKRSRIPLTASHKRRLKSLEKIRPVSEIKCSNADIDVNALRKELEYANDSILLLEKDLDETAINLANLKAEIAERLKAHLKNSFDISLAFLRMDNIDDLDHPIIRIRDTLLYAKIINDSLLYIRDTAAIRYFSGDLRKYRKLSNQLYSAYQYKLNLIRRLKKACAEGLEAEYNETITKARKLADESYSRQVALKADFSRMRPAFKKIYQVSQRELRNQESETKIEKLNRQAFASHISMRNTALQKLVNSNLSETRSVRNAAAEHRKKYTRVSR